MEAERECKAGQGLSPEEHGRSVTSDRMSPRLIELHHGTSRAQPRCSVFLETVISPLSAFMS